MHDDAHPADPAPGTHLLIEHPYFGGRRVTLLKTPLRVPSLPDCDALVAVHATRSQLVFCLMEGGMDFPPAAEIADVMLGDQPASILEQIPRDLLTRTAGLPLLYVSSTWLQKQP